MKQLKLLMIAVFCSTFGLSVFAQPENLYIIGGPFNANKPNWLHRDVVQLEKDSENTNVFYYRGYIGYNTFGDERGNFKILTRNNSWDGYHPVGEINQPIGSAQVGVELGIREGGSDTKWMIPEDRSSDGYYEIKVDTENNTFLIENFTAVLSDFPVGLFLVGGTFIINDGNWNPGESKKMDRDGTNPDLFRFRGYLEHNQWGNEPGNFKILINVRGWEDSFHPEENTLLSSAIEQNTTIRRGGDDTKWNLPEDGSGNGYWEFSVDAKNKTFRVDNFVHDLDYFDHVYIRGSAMPCGWNFSNEPEKMNKVSRGVYSWTGNVVTGDFKFLKYDNSHLACYVATLENEVITLDNAHTVTYEKDYGRLGNDYKFIIGEEHDDKLVTITLDLNTKTIMVSNTITDVDVVKERLVAVYTTQGKVFVNGMSDETYNVRILTVDGRQILHRTIEDNEGITIPKGCYLVTVTDKSGVTTVRQKVVVS